MSDFKSPFDRDLFRAAELGRRAAEFEISTARVRAEAGFITDGITAGSDKIRYEFRKGILNRYAMPVDADEWTRERIADQRKALNVAYYAQPQIISAINAKPEAPDPLDMMAEVIQATMVNLMEKVAA